ncbi:hypothetical protein D3C73_506050 [compost metagenome]
MAQRAQPGNRLDQFGAARADNAGNTKDLPGLHRKRHIVKAPGLVRQLLDTQHHRVCGNRQLREQALDRAPHHLRHQHADIRRAAVVTRDQVTVTHDHDFVGDPGNFVHPVTDVDEGNPFFLQLLDLFEQQIGFVLAQGGGRFVEYQQA